MVSNYFIYSMYFTTLLLKNELRRYKYKNMRFGSQKVLKYKTKQSTFKKSFLVKRRIPM